MEVQFTVAIVVALLALVGTWLTVKASRQKTSTDTKTAFDQRVDERMSEYADRLEKRLEKLEKQSDEWEIERDTLRDRIDVLEESHRQATRREHLLYRYTASLRNHIINGLKPPPPAVPEELADWYESFDVNSTHGLA